MKVPPHPWRLGRSTTDQSACADLQEHAKPWRVPGTDVSDYFNYGFDEFTWALYCLKQDKTRAAVQEDKKGFSMIMDGGPMAMPGMPAPGGGANGMAMPAMPAMPGMGDMGPDMMAQMAQMAQMMGPGMDMSQMDPSMFGMAQTPAGPAGGNQAQGFGPGQQGYAPPGPNQQQMGFGYDNRQGSYAGRGRGANRRNW